MQGAIEEIEFRESSSSNAATIDHPIGPAPGASFFGWLYVVAVVIGLLPVLFTYQAWMIPLVAMVGYFAVGYGKAKDTGTVFEFSDSIYYLGFTLSVGSLLGSLEPFAINKNPEPEKIFHLFGLGMLSTLFGVVARTSLQTFHRLPSETIEAVNLRLTEEARRYVDQLRNLNARAGAALVAVSQNMESTVTPKLKSITETLTQTLGALSDTADASGKLKGQVEDAQKSLQNVMLTLKDSSAEIGRTHSGVVQSAKGLEAALVSLTNTSTASVSPSFDALARKTELARRAFKSFAKQVNEVSIDAKPLETPIRSVGNALQLAAKATQEEVEALKSTVTLFRNSVEAAREAHFALASPELRQALSSLELQVKLLADATEDQRVASGEELGILRGHIEAALRDAQDLSEAMDEVVQEAIRRLEKLPPTSPEILTPARTEVGER